MIHLTANQPAACTRRIQLADSNETAWAGDYLSKIHLDHFAYKRMARARAGR